MTDSRTAALAEACARAGVHIDKRPSDTPRYTPCESCAPAIRAIDAALPPDWCGHVGVEEAIAQGQRMLSEREAEIARLRAVNEVAALELLNCTAEIARLREEVEELTHPRCDAGHAAEITRLREALRPFAELDDDGLNRNLAQGMATAGGSITWKMLDDARAALGEDR